MEDKERLIKIINKNDILMNVFNIVRNFDFEFYYIGIKVMELRQLRHV